MLILSRFLLCFVLLIQSTAAFETDQYNLPTTPLADIGDEVSEYTEENIRRAFTKINAEIAARQACPENITERKSKCGSPENERNRLAYLRSEEAVALEVYRLLGAGFIASTKSGTWMDSHKFRGQPARYKTGYLSSIFVALPTDYFTISPTVNLYGSQFGTDKIAHFFQQGYTYYKIYNRALAKGLKPEEAAKKAVSWGKTSEHTFYGTMVSGVFSNADLYANYAGMKFYQGLARPIKIGDTTRPGILFMDKGIWNFNQSADLYETLIKPFLTDHMNEALNPSIFAVGLRSSVRNIVKKRSCPRWRKLYPDLSQEKLNSASKALMLWNEEDYGFKTSSKLVTIANTCFAADPKVLLTNSPAK